MSHRRLYRHKHRYHSRTKGGSNSQIRSISCSYTPDIIKSNERAINRRQENSSSG